MYVSCNGAVAPEDDDDDHSDDGNHEQHGAEASKLIGEGLSEYDEQSLFGPLHPHFKVSVLLNDIIQFFYLILQIDLDEVGNVYPLL